MTDQPNEPSTGEYQLLPPLADEERADLTESIRKFGIRQAVTVDENNVILDGHHRAKIAAQLGIKQYPVEVVGGLSDQDKRRLVRQLNLARRHLTRKQKEDIIAAALRDEPQKSDRQHAVDLGVSHPTVGKVRSKLEDKGEVEKFSTRTDKQGHARPAGASKQTPPARRRRRPWTALPSPPQSHDERMAEAMVAEFRGGLGKARTLPDDLFKSALAPLRDELVALLGRHGALAHQEEEA